MFLNVTKIILIQYTHGNVKIIKFYKTFFVLNIKMNGYLQLTLFNYRYLELETINIFKFILLFPF